MSSIRFSILLPTYKRAFLSQCIESVLAQTYAHWELLIVNDASPEDIEEVVSHYSDSRIRYYQNATNFGAKRLVEQWNYCLSLASGDYVICMGDDDLLLPNCLSTYAELIERHPDIPLLHGLTQIIDENGEVVRILDKRPEQESAMSLLYHRHFFYRPQYIGDFCFSREALIAQGGFYNLPYAWSSDDISALTAAQKQGLINTQEVVFAYRDNTHSITRQTHISGKLKAIWLAGLWEWQFLRQPTNNAQDELYRKQLKRTCFYHTLRKAYYTIRNAYSPTK